MTDNQFNKLFDVLTELLQGIQEVKQIMKEPKSSVPESKSRFEPQNRLSNASPQESAGKSLRACLET